MKRPIVVGICLVLVIAGTLAFVSAHRPKNVDVAVVDTERIQTLVAVTGQVETEVPAQVCPEVNGLIVKKLNFDAGSVVHHGDIMAVLDSTTVNDQMREAQAALAKDEADLAKGQVQLVGDQRTESLQNLNLKDSTDLKTTLDSAKANAAGTQRQLCMAQAAFAKTSSGGRPEDIEQAESLVRQAQDDAEQKHRDYDRLQALAAADVASKQSAEDAKRDWKAAEEKVIQQQDNLKIVQKSRTEDVSHDQSNVGYWQAQVRGAENAYSNAQRAYAARYQGKITLSSNETQESVDRANIKSLEASLQQEFAVIQGIQTNLRQAVIRSPIDGVVTARQGTVGAASSTTQPLFTVADINDLRIVAQVDDSLVGRVAAGQPAKISLDPYPGLVLDGHVTRVVRSANSVDGTVPVWVHFDRVPGNVTLMPGIFGDITIQGKAMVPALTIPSSALFDVSGSNYVYKLAAGRARRVFVKTLSYGTLAQVETGLAQGDVILVNPESIKDGQRVKVKG